MKNITLSVEDHIINTARSYAQQHHTTLNQLVRDLLKQRVMPSPQKNGIDELFELADRNPSMLENYCFRREDAYVI